MVAIGLAFGLAGAAGLTRIIESMLFDVSPLDPGVFVVACSTMLLVGVAAGAIPARRAAALSPLEVLRDS